MPHMLAAQHQAIYDSRRAGTARNQATILAALAAIGSTATTLLLHMEGDGVWTITSNLSIPANVILQIPYGVTINVATSVTLAVGLVIAAQNNWKTGPGTLTKSAVATPMEISNFYCVTYVQQNSQGGVIWEANGGAGDPAKVKMYLNNGGAGCGISLSRNDANVNSTWQINAVNAGDLHFARPGSNPMMLVNNTGVMFGANVAPSFTLQVGSGDAAKVTGASWQVTSDARLKDVQGPYSQGLAMLLSLPQSVRFKFNGKGGTPADDKEYIGMIAQDVEPIAPYMIGAYQGLLEPEDTAPTALLTLDSSPMIFAVINALREIDARLQALEAPALQATRAETEPEEDDSPRHGPRQRKRSH